ncbi:helix-turn-helix transcriptional regulator [Nocardioides sp. AN3]
MGRNSIPLTETRPTRLSGAPRVTARVATLRPESRHASEGEVLVAAEVEHLRRGLDGPPSELVQYAQGFLRTGRREVRFLWRADGGWLAVAIERHWPTTRTGGEAVLCWTPTALPGGVTSREIDILTLLALGLTNLQVAERLGTSSRTVSSQVERLLLKLEQTSRGGLAALAVDAGLLRLPIPGGATGLTSIGPVEVEQRSSHPACSDPAARTFTLPVAVSFPGRGPFRVGIVVTSCGLPGRDAVAAVRDAALAVAELNAAGGIAGRRIEDIAVDVDLLDPDSVREGVALLVEQRVDAIIVGRPAEPVDALDGLAAFGREQLASYGRPVLDASDASWTAYDCVRQLAIAWAAAGTRDPHRVAQHLRHETDLRTPQRARSVQSA